MAHEADFPRLTLSYGTATPAACAAGGQSGAAKGLRAFALYSLLASLSGASAVLVLDRVSSRNGAEIETGALPGQPISRRAGAALAAASLLRLDDASRHGNFEVFRSAAAPGFQRVNAAADLARIFGWMARDGVTLDVASGDIERSLRIETREPQGMLRLTGQVATQREPLNFDLMFEKFQGAWRLIAIAILKP